MNTSYADVREAIVKHVLVRSDDGVRIVASDELSHAAWLFDFRALLLQPHWLKRYAEIFWDALGSKYPFQVCGMESAAISLVAAIVMEGHARGTPANGLFVRKSRKRQGLMKQLEGTPTADPVILVDDLINSGSTFQKQIKILEGEGLRVSDIFALLRFRENQTYDEMLGPSRTLTSIFSLDDFGVQLAAPRTVRPQLEMLWRFAAPEPSYNHVVQKSAPVLDAERAYFGTDVGNFYALDQKTGAIAWEFKTGKRPDGKGIFSTPLVYKNTVYFGAYDGTVYALDAKTGAKRWTYDGADWVGSSPALAADKNILFIGLEFGLLRKRGGIVALDAMSGKRVWEDRTPALTHGSPFYIKEQNMVVIGSNDDIVYAYEAHTGKLLWRYAVQGSVKSSFAYDPVRQLILFGSLGGFFYAVTPAGVPVFAIEAGAGMYSTPLVDGDRAYFTSLDKKVYAVDLEHGTIVWTFHTNGRIFSSPVMAEGFLYTGSNDGKLYEIDPKTGEGNFVFQATERIVNKIAYNTGSRLFYVPTHANELYCLKQHRAARA